jgi:hypothetical protein
VAVALVSGYGSGALATGCGREAREEGWGPATRADGRRKEKEIEGSGDGRRRGTMRQARKAVGEPGPTAAVGGWPWPWNGGRGWAARGTTMSCDQREVGEPSGCQVGSRQQFRAARVKRFKPFQHSNSSKLSNFSKP